MAIHNFTCDDCGITIEDTNTKKIHKCYKCGAAMRWDLYIGIHGNYKTPIHSDALAINPCQVPEHRKLFPNIELDGDCRPIFDNFKRHQDYLDKTGFIKTPKKVKVKGKKLSIK